MSTTDKQFELYIAKTRLHCRMMRDVRNQFEDANMQPWLERLGACKSLRAVDKLRVMFETADRV